MKLEELEKLVDAATPAPWFADGGDSYSPVRSDHGPICDCDIGDLPDTPRGKANAEFIAKARNVMPKLLRLARAVDQVREHPLAKAMMECTSPASTHSLWAAWERVFGALEEVTK
jgi:hypothetical protein